MENLAFTGGDQDSVEAEYMRLNPKAIVDISYITQEIAFQINRENKELLMRVSSGGAFEPVLEGITDLRLLVDNGAAFIPMTAGSTPTAIRVEVDAVGPGDEPITVSGLVNVRNAP